MNRSQLKDEFAYDLDAFRDERPRTLGAMIKKDPHIFAGVKTNISTNIQQHSGLTSIHLMKIVHSFSSHPYSLQRMRH